MTRISVHTELRYAAQVPTSFIFSVLAASGNRQHVDEERLVVEPAIDVRRVAYGPSGYELLRLTAPPGPLTIVYDAIVTLRPHIPAVPPGVEMPFAAIPPDVLAYLLPSRYCPSDLLSRLAEQTFATMGPGFERVTGICNWIWDRLSYVPGSTDATTTAIDVLIGVEGVCRDYAHLAISLCRALGIPARYLSGYAVDLEPPDFHGFFEAYLDGEWYLFDATRMAPIDGLVRIATGRDAADVAFAALVGLAELTWKEIVVIDLDRTEDPDRSSTPALGTA